MVRNLRHAMHGALLALPLPRGLGAEFIPTACRAKKETIIMRPSHNHHHLYQRSRCAGCRAGRAAQVGASR